MTKAEKETRKNDFEAWITFIPDEVEELKKTLPGDLSKTLDYSRESLDLLEQYLLQNFSAETFMTEHNKHLLDRLARYVGSTFRRNLPNAYWDIELDNNKDAFYLLPVLKVRDARLASLSPHTLITTLLVRRQGDFLKVLLRNVQLTLDKGQLT